MNYSFILAVLAAVSSAVPTPQTGSNGAAAVTTISAQQVPPTHTTSAHCAGTTTSHATLTKVSIAAKQVLAAAPSSASCATNGNNGCSTPDAAAAALSAAFEQYGHKSLGQQAALVGLMALESVDFQFNVNMNPGRPGQGSTLFQALTL